MESTIEPWTYETLKIVVSKDGLEELFYTSPYEMGKTQVENVKLLDFEEIKQIYTEMMQYKVSNQMDNEYLKDYQVNIDRITLGYARKMCIRDSRRIKLKGELTSPINPRPGCRFASRCPYAEDICFKENPKVEMIGDKHEVSCHFVHEINKIH